jgi:hypothetical protein
MRNHLREDTPRAIAVAATFFGALAALGWADGVFARLGDELLAMLAAFALLFAAGTYALDREVRAWVNATLKLRTTAVKSPAAKSAATLARRTSA